MLFDNFSRPKIGLALGGGGAKGLAHIGVIKMLELYNIPIDFIAGTSIGAMVGGFYAYSKNISEIENVAIGNNWPEWLRMFMDPDFKLGLIRGEKVKKFISDYVKNTNFSELKIPFSCTATDIKNGALILKNKGLVSEGIRASISIPGLFKPVLQNNVYLTDGGLSMPVPVKVVKDMGADIVIAVNLYKNYIRTENKKIGFYRIIDNSKDILLHHLANENTKEADIIINPQVDKFGWDNLFTEVNSKKVIHAGEIATLDEIKKIKKLINKKRFNLNNLFKNIFSN